MAVARTQESIQAGERVSWREAAKAGYYWVVGAAALALLVLVPPQLDHSIWTLLAVVVILPFLIIAERYDNTSGVFAPMTAVIAAAAAIVGGWCIVLAGVTWAVLRWRHYHNIKESNYAKVLTGYVGQIGVGLVASYCTLYTYVMINHLGHFVPAFFAPAATFGAIVVAGLMWQTINNGLAQISFIIMNKHVNAMQGLAVGVFASVWAYFLFAIYSFGGILALGLFYVIVTQSQAIDRIMGAIEARGRVDLVATQSRRAIQQLMLLGKPSDVELGEEVRYFAGMLARGLELPKVQVDLVTFAAAVHDIGRCKLDPSLRDVPNPTAGQEAMRARYPRLGGELLRELNTVVPAEVPLIVERQAEWFDGSGPVGLRGTRIPLEARIIAIARGYAEQLSGYAGKPALPKEQALKALCERAGSQYDPSLVDLLCRQVS
jgi:hypothetical protein